MRKGKYRQRQFMMAASIFRGGILFKKILDHTPKYNLVGVRQKSKRDPNLPPLKRKKYGQYVGEGATVTSGTTLARQFHLKYCAGLNVGYTKTYLYAKVPGKVMLTSEVTNFDPEHPLVKRVSPDQTVLCMDYYHVIPEPQHTRFKLIDTN